MTNMVNDIRMTRAREEILEAVINLPPRETVALFKELAARIEDVAKCYENNLANMICDG